MGETDLKGRTKTFTLKIIELFGLMPTVGATPILGKQLLRSGTSVGANYHEAYPPVPRPSFWRKWVIVAKS